MLKRKMFIHIIGTRNLEDFTIKQHRLKVFKKFPQKILSKLINQ